MKSDHLRLFVAITLPPAATEPLARALEATRAIAPEAKLVPIANLHLTLHFLGATPATARPALERALLEVAAASAPLPIAIRGADTFGRRARPRLLYAAIADGAAALTSLAAKVRAGIGAAPSARFTPHVTLARARDPRGDVDLARARAALAALACPPFAARSLALMRSEASAEGSRYQILSEAAFLP